MTQQHRLKLIMLVVTFLTLVSVPALAEGEPRLTLFAESSAVAAGQEVVVALRVEDVSPAVRAEAHLTFDPTTLAVIALEHGDFLSPDPDTDAFILEHNFDNQAGIINYALWLKPGQPAAAGNGLLATVTFQALTTGLVAVEIQEGRFFSPDRAELIALTDSIQLTVGDGATADSAPTIQEQPAPVGSVVQEASAPITPPVQKQSAPDQTARTDDNSSMTEAAPAVQEQPIQAGSARGTEAEAIIEPGHMAELPEPSLPITPPVQQQSAPDQTAWTDDNSSTTEAAPAVQEQPIQAVTSVGNESETVIESERVEKIREPSLRLPRRFNVQTQSDPGDNRLLALLLVAGLGLVVLFIGLVGFVALASAWFWLIRSRRRHSLGRIQ